MSESVEVLLLAAGRSSRTGDRHKLLAEFEGEPMLRRAARQALASRARGVTVVLGHRASEMREVLDGLPLRIVENADYADGMASSILCGLKMLPDDTGGALVTLADQPWLRSIHLDRLIGAFSPEGRGSIVVATHDGRRFNPVLLSMRHRTQILALRGDVGARSIVAANGELVETVELGIAASFDIDTVEAIAEAGGRLVR